MEKFVRMVGFVCICKQKQAICQGLNCLIKYLYTAEEMVRNAFFGGAPVSFHFSLGISFSSTLPHLSSPLVFSLALTV